MKTTTIECCNKSQLTATACIYGRDGGFVKIRRINISYRQQNKHYFSIVFI